MPVGAIVACSVPWDGPSAIHRIHPLLTVQPRGVVRELCRDPLEVNREMNVMPFIDVIPVLRINFMVVASLATVDAAGDPPISTAQRRMRSDKPIFPAIKADRGLSPGDVAVAPDGLAGALHDMGIANGPFIGLLRAHRTRRRPARDCPLRTFP